MSNWKLMIGWRELEATHMVCHPDGSATLMALHSPDGLAAIRRGHSRRDAMVPWVPGALRDITLQRMCLTDRGTCLETKSEEVTELVLGELVARNACNVRGDVGTVADAVDAVADGWLVKYSNPADACERLRMWFEHEDEALAFAWRLRANGWLAIHVLDLTTGNCLHGIFHPERRPAG